MKHSSTSTRFCIGETIINVKRKYLRVAFRAAVKVVSYYSNILRTRFAPYYYYISVICCGILKWGSSVRSATVLENEVIMAFYGTWWQAGGCGALVARRRQSLNRQLLLLILVVILRWGESEISIFYCLLFWK